MAASALRVAQSRTRVQVFAPPTPAIPTELPSRLGKVSRHSLISRQGAERSSSSQQLGAAPAVRKSRMQDLR